MSTSSQTIESLSETGISISNLTNLSEPSVDDLLLIQDISEGQNGLTKNITLSQLTTRLSEVSFTNTVEYTNTSNIFSGSFYGYNTSIPSNFYNIIARNNLTVNNNITVTGTLSVTGTSTLSNNVTLSSGNLVVSTGNLTISSGTTTLQSIACGSIVSSGTINGTSLTTTTITGDTITANTRFVGNITGGIRGNIYSDTGTLVLENGADVVGSSNYYGTSSYADKADYAVLNGIPTGGTSNQVLVKNSTDDYDFSWQTSPGATGVSTSDVKTIVSSSLDGESDFLTKFDGNNHITKSVSLYENEGMNSLIVQSGFNVTISTGNLTLGVGDLTLAGGSITVDKSITLGQTSSAVSTTQTTIFGNLYTNTSITLGSDTNITMSLNSGQSANVLVINGGDFQINAWSASYDGGTTVAEKLYWEGGTVPTILTGATDIYTFKNINGKIFASSMQNFN
jgi:hypothetical protein